jgi:type II secretory pathway component GspD/PulD (secretin)
MTRGRHLRGRSAAAVGLLLLLGITWQAPAARADGPNADQKAKDSKDVELRDYYFLRDDLVRNKDGTYTWFYVTNHVGATTLKKSLDELKIPGLKTMTRGRDTFRVQYDPTKRVVNLAVPPTRMPGIDENILLLTFPPGYKDIIEEFLERFDVAEAQVYIKAKVVEVTLDSNLEYGVSWFFDRGGGDASTGAPGSANPNAFFRAFRSQFRPGSFSGAPLSPENTGLSLLFDDLTMDEGTIVATIEALQERGSANLLSEPSIVATQGQLATLVTGEETPVQELKVTGASETVTTVFKDTGIKLDFHPLHIGREFVKLRVRVEVSSVTGFVEAISTQFVIQNPVISQRNAETVVTIRDGMTLVIGGLYAVSEIEDKVGVPILADIPVLSFLFSKKKKTKVKSELDFFITPHILRQRLAKTVFIPPGEKGRLRRIKDKGDAEESEE